jgi:hypothetical protein
MNEGAIEQKKQVEVRPIRSLDLARVDRSRDRSAQRFIRRNPRPLSTPVKNLEVRTVVHFSSPWTAAL